MAGRLEFKRLVLTSPARNYEVQFHGGVNVIAGPISTGKTSVLELLDYACGARTPPTYPELAKCSDVLVEIVAGGEVLTVRRALKGSHVKAFLYEAPVAEVLQGEAIGVEVSARHEANAPSISLEVLNRLGFGTFKVKTAPTKDVSETSSFSLRDLLLLLYVDQDRMGSKTSFFEDDHFKANKWKAAFEIVHGLFDESAASTADALRLAERQEQEMLRYLQDARKFLDQFKVPSLVELDAQERSSKQEIARAREKLARHKAGERARLGESSQLAERRNQLADTDRSLSARIDELRRNSRQLGRLRVQYERELDQWRFLHESKAVVGSIPVVRCPACFQAVALAHEIEQCHLCKLELQKESAEISIENRVKAGSRRISDLDSYLADLVGAADKLEQERAEVRRSVLELDRILHRVRESSVLAETRAIIEANEDVALLEKKREKVQEQIAYRKRSQGEGTTLLAVQSRVRELREAQRLAEGQKLSPETVVQDLAAWYQALLSDIKFPALRDASVDRVSYRPIVRGQPYRELSSKGAISLAVVAWHVAILEYALRPESPSRFPLLLLLDSPLSHVGRDATDPEFRDQQLVDGFYAVMERLHKRADQFQVFICDNRPPTQARGMIAVEFTGDASVGRYGLIDDEHPPAIRVP